MFIEKKNQTIDDNNNIFYKHLVYCNKKYYLSTEMKQAKINNKIVYFCNNHNTTKLSNKFDHNGRKKKISFCESKIIYDKLEKKFILINEHSDLCNKIQYPKYENSLEIEKEINNYEDFKITIENILKNNIFITFKEYINNIYKIYDESKYNFDFPLTMVKNKYYNWRNKARVFSIESIYDKPTTKNGKNFLRSSVYKLLYKENGNNLFIHKHIIYISDFFIRKLQNIIIHLFLYLIIKLKNKYI